MVVDSSALLAIYYNEEDAAFHQGRIEEANSVSMSSCTFVEAWVAVLRKLGADRAEDFDLLVRQLKIDIIDFDLLQAVIAREAYLRYGRTRHAAQLNLGDCFSYALAKQLGEPLLFKGNDFSLTDVLKA